jgi:hypothetical protein
MSTVRKAKYGEEALGVISTRPGILLGGNTTNGVPVAFSGRVPVLVTDENGLVKQGDYLTISSSTPGYAMKAAGSSYAIGRAISDAINASTSKVLMVVENKHREMNLSSIEGLANIATSSESFVRATTTVYDMVTNKLSHSVSVVNEYFSLTTKAVAGYFDKLFAKEIYTDKVCIKKSNGEDVCLTGDQVENVLNATQIPLLTPEVNNNQGGGSSTGVVDTGTGTQATSTIDITVVTGTSSAPAAASTTLDVAPAASVNASGTGGGVSDAVVLPPAEIPVTP